MIQRVVTLRENACITPCPKCGNNSLFTARSQQVGEDICEVWVACQCGYDPTKGNTDHRVEDIWGSLDQDTVMCALLNSWNYPLAQQHPAARRNDDQHEQA